MSSTITKQELGEALGVGAATVHILDAGLPLCRFSRGVPAEWPAPHLWVRLEEANKANCVRCRRQLDSRERP